MIYTIQTSQKVIYSSDTNPLPHLPARGDKVTFKNIQKVTTILQVKYIEYVVEVFSKGFVQHEEVIIHCKLIKEIY